MVNHKECVTKTRFCLYNIGHLDISSAYLCMVSAEEVETKNKWRHSVRTDVRVVFVHDTISQVCGAGLQDATTSVYVQCLIALSLPKRKIDNGSSVQIGL